MRRLNLGTVTRVGRRAHESPGDEFLTLADHACKYVAGLEMEHAGATFLR